MPVSLGWFPLILLAVVSPLFKRLVPKPFGALTLSFQYLDWTPRLRKQLKLRVECWVFVGIRNALLFKTAASLPSASIQATETLSNFPFGGSTQENNSM